MELESQINRNKHTHHCREQCLSLSLTVKVRYQIYFPGNFNNKYYFETVSVFTFSMLPPPRATAGGLSLPTGDSRSHPTVQPHPQTSGYYTHVYVSERNFQEPFSGSGLNCGTWKKNQQAKVRFQKSRNNHLSNLELGCTTHRSHRKDQKKVNRGWRVYG